MKKTYAQAGIIALVVIAGGCTLYALPRGTEATTLHIEPAIIFQGDPVMVTVTGTSTAGITKGTIENVRLYFFDRADRASALYGIDLEHKIGTTSVSVVFSDGSVATTSFVIQRRPRPYQSLPIPTQLGGNSSANQTRVVSILTIENKEIAQVKSAADQTFFHATGTAPFVFPLVPTKEKPLVVTNAYGYDRDSGSAVIPHKGTDWRAATATPVYAIAGGVVRVAKPFVIYGDTVIIDHGAGVLSMYMHMSELALGVGDTVKAGQRIGLSGDKGYAEGAHLHLSIRVGGVSIDPMRFFGLFGVK